MKKMGKNNISLSQSGMRSMETPNTTLFKQENGLFDPTICAFKWKSWKYNGGHINTHMCAHGQHQKNNANGKFMKTLYPYTIRRIHTPFSHSSSRSLRPALAQYICVYDGHLLLCHKNEMTITIRMDETEKR